MEVGQRIDVPVSPGALLGSTTVVRSLNERMLLDHLRSTGPQSPAEPSHAEYWHMGAAATRLGTVMGPILSGENSAGDDIGTSYGGRE